MRLLCLSILCLGLIAGPRGTVWALQVDVDSEETTAPHSEHSAAAEEYSQDASHSGHSGHAESHDDHEEPDDLKKQLQKRKLEIGVILTACIFVLGIFLVVVTLIYGRRTRRQLASGRGSTAARDDLWYLKNERKNIFPAEADGSQEETP